MLITVRACWGLLIIIYLLPWTAEKATKSFYLFVCFFVWGLLFDVLQLELL